MFDVAWTDPSTETVGQRRQRKERQAGKSGRSGSINTISSSSLHSQTNGVQRSKTPSSGWGFFGGSKNSSGKGKGKEKDYSARPRPHDELIEVSSKLEDKNSQRDVGSKKDIQEQESMHSVQRPPTPVESVFSLPTNPQTESSWGGSVSDISSSRYQYRRSPPAPSTFYELENQDYYQTRESATIYEDPDALESRMSEVNLTTKDEDFEFVSEAGSQQFPRTPSNAERSRRPSNGKVLPRKTSKPQTRAIPEPPRPENSAIRLRVRRMEVANPRIILQRLMEEWDEDEDEAIYNELQFEKHLWMLVGLRYLLKASDARQGARNDATEACKVLSLYESQACANILSTLYPIGSKTHHLTTTPPVNAEQTSHLHTLIVSAPTTKLPYAPATFTTIASLRLPMLLPSSSIPSILQECHRVLGSNGALQLTIMDPIPVASTLGPKFRAWLEDHLLLTLETQFRCLKPAKLMPIWLENAGFRATAPAAEEPGVTLKITESMVKVAPVRTGFSFRAVGRGEGGFRGPGREKERESRDMLASTVGRMLWREIYGPFVVGRIWWWEDEEIVEEAYARGTKWDVVVTEAIKK